MNKVVYHYPKDEQGNKTGHTLCIIVDGDDVFVGEALCSKSDSFSKAQGRNIAYVRALKRKQRATEARAQHQAARLLQEPVALFDLLHWWFGVERDGRRRRLR